MLFIDFAMPFSIPIEESIQQGFERLLSKIHSSDDRDDSTFPRDSTGYLDPRFKRVLWYLIGSTKGGVNRAKILKLLNERPANPNQVSTVLKLDYKTVLHHLKVLSENGLVITDNKDKYGATYFLTPIMEKNYPSFKAILEKIEDV